MATLKQRMHRKNGSGYDVVHLETESSLVLRPNGETVEQSLITLKNIIEKGSSNSGCVAGNFYFNKATGKAEIDVGFKPKFTVILQDNPNNPDDSSHSYWDSIAIYFCFRNNRGFYSAQSEPHFSIWDFKYTDTGFTADVGDISQKPTTKFWYVAFK